MNQTQRIAAYVFCAGVLGAILSPAMRSPEPGHVLPRDSFPLSTYPMFSARRDNPQISRLVGYTADGEERAIPPRLLGTDEVMQAATTVARAAANKKRARALCREVAGAVATDPALRDVVRLEVLTLRYDPIAYFTEPDGRAHPTSQKRRARCKVVRGQEAGS